MLSIGKSETIDLNEASVKEWPLPNTDTTNPDDLEIPFSENADFSLSIKAQKSKAIKKGKSSKKSDSVKSIICDVCDKEFPSKINLKQHQQLHSQELKFECEICLKRFIWRSSYNQHKDTHSKERIFPCDMCDKRFSNRHNRNQHQRLHSQTLMYSCDICSKQFKFKANLKDHKLRHLGKRKFFCEHCDKGFVTLSSLKRHSSIHEGEAKFKCHLCEERFHKLIYLKRHNVKHFGTATLQCEHCGKLFTSSSNYANHLLRHSGEKFECTNCGKKVKSKYVLKRHSCEAFKQKKTRADKGRPRKKFTTPDQDGDQCIFKCSTCDKTFSNRIYLNMHLKIHSERNFICSVCGHRFLYRYHLVKHMEMHTRDHHCSVCNRLFRNRSCLNQHRLIHLTEWKYECSICSKRFISSKSLSRHYHIHENDESPNGQRIECQICKVMFDTKEYRVHKKTHREKKFCCEKCGKRFYRKCDLKVHCVVHSKERPKFPCELCHKVFSQKAYLNKHKLIHFREKTFECTVCHQFLTLEDFPAHNLMHRGQTDVLNTADEYVCQIENNQVSQNGGAMVNDSQAISHQSDLIKKEEFSCQTETEQVFGDNETFYYSSMPENVATGISDPIKSETAEPGTLFDVDISNETASMTVPCFNQNNSIQQTDLIPSNITQINGNTLIPNYHTVAQPGNILLSQANSQPISLGFSPQNGLQNLNLVLVLPSSGTTNDQPSLLLTNQGIPQNFVSNVNVSPQISSEQILYPPNQISFPTVTNQSQIMNCEISNDEFTTPNPPPVESVNESQPRRFTCSYCNKTFAHSSSLARHKKSHTAKIAVQPKSENVF